MMVLREMDIDVLTAAKRRIRNVFANGLPVYMSFSGGKDSLTLADITLELIRAGEIDAKQLRVEFIDEEGIFPCVEDIVLKWREKFLMLGARFDWYCLEVKHFSCLNQLENDESFICWDSRKQDVWIRQPQPFAIRNHPLLKPRVDTYQAFLARLSDGHHMTGVRAFESIQRRSATANQRSTGILSSRTTIEPIYDWKDDDVWLYLMSRDIEIPAAYLYLYQIGVPRNRLRISQFFSIDTAYTLARMSEFYPDLMERILRREPSAYIVSLYWDSEMFRRSSAKRREIDEAQEAVDYRSKVIALLSDIEGNFTSEHSRFIADEYRRRLLRDGAYMTESHYKMAYDAIIAGDPKKRTLRSLVSQIYRDAAIANVPGQSSIHIRNAAKQ